MSLPRTLTGAAIVIFVGSIALAMASLIIWWMPGDAPAWAPVGCSSPLIGVLVGAALGATGDHLGKQRRFQADLRTATTTLRDLRPGNPTAGSQPLTCQIEVRLPGEQPWRGRYRTDVGPLDAPRLVEQATFACQANPGFRDLVWVYPYDMPDEPSLSGRRLTFTIAIEKT